jgi:hypothetical protein
MKNFFITFLFLVLIAAAGLFFGWAQLGIPPDGYGVIRSKTHGLYPRLIQPGEFKWIWYKLIPTNTTTTVLRLNHVTREFNAKRELPSGRIYSAFAGIDDDFSWEINAFFSFSLSPYVIIPLFSDNHINSQEDLASYEESIARDVENFILRRIDQEDASGQVETLLTNGENPEFDKEILERFPVMYNFSLRVRSAKLPDFALYRQARGLFEDYITLQREYIADHIENKAKNRIDSIIRFNELELYGELLTRYPILLDYMSLENKIR